MQQNEKNEKMKNMNTCNRSKIKNNVFYTNNKLTMEKQQHWKNIEKQ